MALFVGRLPPEIRSRDLEDLFYKFGRIIRCDVKRGVSYSFGFVEFEDRRDAEDAIRNLDGSRVQGTRIVVEWGTSGGPKKSRRSPPPRRRSPSPRRRSASPGRRKSPSSKARNGDDREYERDNDRKRDHGRESGRESGRDPEGRRRSSRGERSRSPVEVKRSAAASPRSGSRSPDGPAREEPHHDPENGGSPHEEDSK